MKTGDASMPSWRKSVRCGANTGCVEIARLSADDIGVRDSKDVAASPVLAFASTVWESFLDGVKVGRFDLS
jgi:hypothetical protein